MLCAGVELDPDLRRLCAQVQADFGLTHGSPTFDLAKTIASDSHWSAFTPASPLRQWQLLEVGASMTVMTAPLRIDEQILHYLAGLPHVDERLIRRVQVVEAADFLVPSHEAVVDRLVATWQPSEQRARPIVQLCGSEPISQQAIAAEACQRLGLNLYLLSSRAIDPSPEALQELVRVLEREMRLSQAVLLVWSTQDEALRESIAYLVETITSPLMVMSRTRRSLESRLSITFEVQKPTSEEQFALWQQALGDRVTQLHGFIPKLVSQFNLETADIQAASVQLSEQKTEQDARADLWAICRSQARPQLDELAQRIDPGESWDDLVLPEAQRQILQDMVAHVRQR